MKRLLEDARRIIKVGSISPNGNDELVNLLSILMEERGFKVQSQNVTHSFDGISKRQFNLIATIGDPLVERKIKRGVLFVSPLDTVYPAATAAWTESEGQPFQLTQKGDRLYGLGTAHAKLDFLAKLLAAQKFRDQKLKTPIYVAGVCASELGMLGAKYLLRSSIVNPRQVWVGAPTNLHFVKETKAHLGAKLVISYQLRDRDARGFNRRVLLTSNGKAAHTAFPQQGSHALMNLLGFLKRSMDSGFELQLTRIQGGSQVGQIPDFAESEFFLTSHQFEDFKRFFKDIIRSLPDPSMFKVEMGGVGDVGVSFLPDTIFPSVLELVDALRSVSSRLEAYYDPEYSPPVSTVVITQIRHLIGGIELTLDARLLRQVNGPVLQEFLHEAIRQVAPKFPSLNLTLRPDTLTPGLIIDPENEAFKKALSMAKDLDLPQETKKLAITTEGGLFQQAGYDTFVWGPGSPDANVHGPNEYNEESQLDRAIQFYQSVIEKNCL